MAKKPIAFRPIKRDIRRRYRYPLALETAEGWWLIYDYRAKSGTGPFKTRKELEDYYNFGGR